MPDLSWQNKTDQSRPRILVRFYSDAAGNTHGFVFASGAFSTVDVAGASATQLTRIKNDGRVTGVYSDALSEQHGLIGQ